MSDISKVSTDYSADEILEMLQDPAVVLVNMMRGQIAKLSPKAIASLYSKGDLLEALEERISKDVSSL